MSFANIALTKSEEDAATVTYRVTSPDFAAGEWEEVARVVVDKNTRTYEFLPINRWADAKVVPPYVYGLDDVERETLLAGKYVGYGYGAWTGRIFSRVRQMLTKQSYPESL
ncbi:MAG: hypothetical protein JF606_03020 [Burkholderiales bacterium]|nr:hypothetical protein [Burkholderiales bacterium]